MPGYCFKMQSVCDGAPHVVAFTDLNFSRFLTGNGVIKGSQCISASVAVLNLPHMNEVCLYVPSITKQSWWTPIASIRLKNHDQSNLTAGVRKHMHPSTAHPTVSLFLFSSSFWRINRAVNVKSCRGSGNLQRAANANERALRLRTMKLIRKRGNAEKEIQLNGELRQKDSGTDPSPEGIQMQPEQRALR